MSVTLEIKIKCDDELNAKEESEYEHVQAMAAAHHGIAAPPAHTLHTWSSMVPPGRKQGRNSQVSRVVQFILHSTISCQKGDHLYLRSYNREFQE